MMNDIKNKISNIVNNLDFIINTKFPKVPVLNLGRLKMLTKTINSERPDMDIIRISLERIELATNDITKCIRDDALEKVIGYRLNNSNFRIKIINELNHTNIGKDNIDSETMTLISDFTFLIENALNYTYDESADTLDFACLDFKNVYLATDGLDYIYYGSENPLISHYESSDNKMRIRIQDIEDGKMKETIYEVSKFKDFFRKCNHMHIVMKVKRIEGE